MLAPGVRQRVFNGMNSCFKAPCTAPPGPSSSVGEFHVSHQLQTLTCALYLLGLAGALSLWHSMVGHRGTRWPNVVFSWCIDAADQILAANMVHQGRALVDAASEPAHPVRDAMDGVW